MKRAYILSGPFHSSYSPRLNELYPALRGECKEAPPERGGGGKRGNSLAALLRMGACPDVREARRVGQDEERLLLIAKFFGVTVEWLRRDHRQSPSIQPDDTPLPGLGPEPPLLAAGQAPPDAGPSFGAIAGVDAPPLPSREPAPPGNPASFFGLARYFVD